jgi:hypothetical protein
MLANKRKDTKPETIKGVEVWYVGEVDKMNCSGDIIRICDVSYWITMTQNSTQIGHQQFAPEQIFTCQYDGLHHLIYSHKIIRTTSILFMTYIPVKEDVGKMEPGL